MAITDTRLGVQIGNYRIEQFLGRGGMGVVYRAEHVHLGRRVALKLLAPELAENESFRERFVRESRLAAAIDHPNVIPIYEAAEHDGNYFIAMRYVEGVDLRDILVRESPLTLERALAILTQVAAGLDAAHVQGLVHRDVKPGNVLVVAGSDHCYLTDFGLTKAISSNSGFTATGQFVGTTDYVAPEQIEGREIDRRTDVYSLGCVFYECLTGSPPYQRENDMAKLWAHVQEPPPRLTAARPDLPPELDAVLAAAMAKTKDQRYPSCSAFAAAARAALEVGTGRTFVPPVVPPPTTDQAARPAPPPADRTRADEEMSFPPHAQPVAYRALGYPVAAPAPPRQKPVTAIAIILAALLLAGGGAAAALIVTAKKSNHATAAPARAAAPQPAPQPPPVRKPHHKPRATTPPPQPPVTTDTTPTPAPGGDAAVQSVQDYWNALAAGQFHEAYTHLDPAAAKPEDVWTSERQRDGLFEVTFNSIDATVTGDSATVSADFETLQDSCQPQHWTGTFDMVNQNGEWLIHSRALNNPPC